MSDMKRRPLSDTSKSQWSRRPNPVFSEPYRAIVRVLAQARREAGLAQRELALRIGKCPSHIAQIERGQRRIDCLELYRMARALDLDPAELFLEMVRAVEAAEAGEARCDSSSAQAKRCNAA